MRLTVQAEGPGIDIDRFVAAIPLLLARARAVEFTTDGRAVLDGRPADRLRLVDGTAGRAGAAYRVVGDGGAVTTATVTRDDAEALDVELGADSADTVTAGTISLERPGQAARVQVAGALTVQDAPRVVGSRWDVAGQARLADWSTGSEPQVEVQLDGRLGSAHSTARIDSGTAEPEAIGAPTSWWTVALDIELRPRGLARLAALALPFVRRRVSEAIAEQIREALTETAEQVATDFDPDDGPREIADRAWAHIVADLTTPTDERPSAPGT